jgi:hypothetical protein
VFRKFRVRKQKDFCVKEIKGGKKKKNTMDKRKRKRKRWVVRKGRGRDTDTYRDKG